MSKVLVLGIDGMDPKMTRRMVDEGKLPHIKQFIERGSARQDLVMLGAQPTITPPMWTTMATGAYPMTHGITCYWNPYGSTLDTFQFAFDSRQVLVEQIWETAANAGKKTLVWTWPSSWPVRIDSSNLHMVSGAAPSGPNTTEAVIEKEQLTYASVAYQQITKRVQAQAKGGAGCIITEDMKATPEEAENYLGTYDEITPKGWILLDHLEGEEIIETESVLAIFQSPIIEPRNWTQEIPVGAREFTIIAGEGVIRYPALMLLNEKGEYDSVAVYENKKEAEPFIVMQDGEFYPTVVSDIVVGDKRIKGTRAFSIVKIDPKGDEVRVSLGVAFDIETENRLKEWVPQSLYQQVVDIAGYIPYANLMGNGYPELISRRVLPSWDAFTKWQAKALMGLIEQNGYEAVFTHIHSIDHLGHPAWRWGKSREKYGWNDEKLYQGFLEEIYLQADEYIASFMPLLEQGWDIIITSDHGLLCSEEDELPYLGEGFVMNVKIMQELGYTVLHKDADGHDLRSIDWEKTTAVAPRGNHIYINLKGRNPNGIVDPSDQYELERRIIDDLYSYRLNGKRVVNVALRNKDAILLGLSGARCGDIIYFIEEGFNRLHGDALSTTEGYFGTSVSPIFIAAGPGIKAGYTTERVIREVDLAPTVSALLRIPIPAQCEGAPIYQILDRGSYII